MTRPVYVSTRGQAEQLGFGDALLTGLATDGGLYCPVEFPPLPDISTDTDYRDAAVAIMAPYVAGTFDVAELETMVGLAYDSFRHRDVCPVVELGGAHHLLDLSQGPTLAFKDVALQLVGRMLDAELSRRGRRATILGATSGDTGSAAIEALAGLETVDVVILHPAGRVSDVQRRQMTTVDAANVHNIAVRGTFDDCQDLVKAAFNDRKLREAVSLGAVNSINWARVMAQIVYYVTSARAVRPDGGPVSFSVPTGNFGNVLAGWYAKQMGLLVNTLIVASNRNDVLTRFFEGRTLEIHQVEPSLSPSMDIQVSSNFERLLWETSGRDGAKVADLLGELRSTNRAEVPAGWCRLIDEAFVAYRLSDEETLQEIKRTHSELGLILDPHTAIGVGAARQYAHALGDNGPPGSRYCGEPVITLATADAAKFPDAVEAALGQRPELPEHLADLFDRQENYDEIDNDLAIVADRLHALRTGS